MSNHQSPEVLFWGWATSYFVASRIKQGRLCFQKKRPLLLRFSNCIFWFSNHNHEV